MAPDGAECSQAWREERWIEAMVEQGRDRAEVESVLGAARHNGGAKRADEKMHMCTACKRWYSREGLHEHPCAGVVQLEGVE